MTRTSTVSGRVIAQTVEFPLLQNAQQFGLQSQRHFADLVEQERPARSQRKLSQAC